jgi:hypothetical protein
MLLFIGGNVIIPKSMNYKRKKRLEEGAVEKRTKAVLPNHFKAYNSLKNQNIFLIKIILRLTTP